MSDVSKDKTYPWLLNIPRVVVAIGLLIAAVAVSGPLWDVYQFRVHAKDELVKHLPEPDATQFRNLHYLGYVTQSGYGSFVLCGEVNAKNRFGGYDGFKPFIVEANPKDLSQIWASFIGDAAASYAQSICLKQNMGLKYKDYDFLGKEWFLSKKSDAG